VKNWKTFVVCRLNLVASHIRVVLDVVFHAIYVRNSSVNDLLSRGIYVCILENALSCVISVRNRSMNKAISRGIYVYIPENVLTHVIFVTNVLEFLIS
jgi:large-conductance mechanosensitive channel